MTTPAAGTGTLVPMHLSRDPESLVGDVTDVLHARGERMTAPRRAVLEALVAHSGHIGAEDLVAAVATLNPAVHRASVYRALDTLSGLGVVQHVHTGHDGTTYHLSAEQHLHAQCRSCGTVLDLDPDLLDDVARTLLHRHGFSLHPGHVALSGLCHGCSPHPAPHRHGSGPHPAARPGPEATAPHQHGHGH